MPSGPIAGAVDRRRRGLPAPEPAAPRSAFSLQMPPIGRPPLRRRWIVAIAALAAAGCGRYERHPVVQVAVEEVAVNAKVKEAIGGGVKRTGPVTGSSSDTDGVAALQFDVAGSSGGGTIVVEGKRLDGRWGVTLLELRRPGTSEHLMLTEDLEARTGTDTPRFDPRASPSPSSGVPPPPSEIEIPLPPGSPR